MSDDNIRFVIVCDKKNKLDTKTKTKAKRRANRTISRIEFGLKEKAMGAEPPQRRPFTKEIKAREARMEKIKKKDAERSTPLSKRRCEQDDSEQEQSKQQRRDYDDSPPGPNTV